mmetsp:Transcript_8395/g.12180  ORF Transcript_8395/g.12180 Transcript_8395/m.12180 type:complete len:243 (-) Transcript_8395:127-855(-)|eukprot:CAMPEP_0194203268 /NCGR_PEP_ID=MMETSP0156-20130528/3094_1 /TAXON_ID=33649 /ORGANISM="Thalassionema nitzschioides, Strain L26-B" /LENGTH=242 /DNA_ID=CAMNT_0038928979 /DNA_START=25 /DNA_END=753 /DNA_ORIENTATION=-
MDNKLLALFLICASLSVSIEGFAIRPNSLNVAVFTRQSSTCMFAEEADEEASSEEPAAKDDAPDDILNSPAFLQRKLDVLKSDIAKVEEDIEKAKAQVEEGKAEWGQQLDDLEGEFESIQDRFSRQGKQGDEVATIDVARKMLEVLDNYDRAFAAINAETDEEKAIEAQYQAVYDRILTIFTDLGITEVETVGIEFDYEYHQAVMQRPSDEYEEGIVCEELQKGYIYNKEKLIRAAMVSVAA